MNDKQRLLFADFVVTLTTNRPDDFNKYDIAQTAVNLVRASSQLQKIHETACNVGMSDKLQKRDLKLRRQVEAALLPFGIIPRFNTDPRGWPIILGGADQAMFADRVPCF